METEGEQSRRCRPNRKAGLSVGPAARTDRDAFRKTVTQADIVFGNRFSIISYYLIISMH